MKIRYILFVLILFLFALEANSQSYLVLRKQGTLRKYEFFPGDEFIYKMNGVDVFFKDQIQDFKDSTIVLKNNLLHITQIAEVDVRNADSNRSKFLTSLEYSLPVIGIGYFGIDFINVAVVEGEPYRVDSGVATWSAAMVATGFGLGIVKRKIFKLHKPGREAFIVGF